MELNFSYLCKELFYMSFCEQTSHVDSLYIITKIFKLLKKTNYHKCFDFDNDVIPFMIDCVYTSLGQLLNTNNILFFNGKEISVTLLEYLLEIEKKDKINNLFTHLNLTTLVTLAYVINTKNDVTSQELIKYATISLFHDVGKIIDVVTENSDSVEFLFWGNLGASILQQLWSPKFGEPFSVMIWEEICRTINVYSTGQNNIDEYKWTLLSNELYPVKENLIYLSFGDYFGSMLCESNKITTQQFIDSRPMFLSKIMEQFDCNIFFSKHEFDNVIMIVRGNNLQHSVVQLLEHIKNVNVKFLFVSFNDALRNYDLRSRIQPGNLIVLVVEYDDYFRLEKILPGCLNKTFVIFTDILNNNRFNGTSDGITNIIPKKIIPNTVFVITLNEIYSVGLRELLRQLEIFSKCVTKIKNISEKYKTKEYEFIQDKEMQELICSMCNET